MAAIDTYPVTLRTRNPTPVPPVPQSLKPRVRPCDEIPSLNPKQRYVIEFLASMSGRAELRDLPAKAGLLSVASLSARGLVRVTLEFTPRGKAVFEALAEKELRADKRAAFKLRQAKIDAAS